MLLEKIPLGRTLEIFIDRQEYRYRLVSKVEDVNAKRVCVTALASNGRFFQFLSEDRIRIVYRDQEVMWEWDHVKAGLAKLEDGTAVHYFLIQDPGKTFNRRNAYRVKILEDTTMHYFAVPGKKEKYAYIPTPVNLEEYSEDEREEMSKPKAFAGMIKDVSENGVGIYSDMVLNKEDGIFFALVSPYGELKMKAAVVRKTEATSSRSKYKYYYGCVLTQSDRKLLRYIFDLQREFLKKHNA